MKKRILSTLLCMAIVLGSTPILPLQLFSTTAHAENANQTADEKNISNTSTDDLSTLGFNTDSSEVVADTNSNTTPTGKGAYALRTQPELLVTTNQKNSLYDFENGSIRFDNHGAESDWYTTVFVGNPDSAAYKLPSNVNYTFIKGHAFDPTGSGKDDYMAYTTALNSGNGMLITLHVINKDGSFYGTYSLGKTPFGIFQHQSDGYIPITAGDYDGDGCEELAVYYFGNGANDSELDIRILDVDVNQEVPITQHTMQTTAGTKYAVYNFSTLGFNKSEVIDQSSSSYANMKLYPIVDLTTVEQPGDECDDLVISASHSPFINGLKLEDTASRIVFWVDPCNEMTNKINTFKGVWNYEKDYGSTGANKAEMMGSAGVGTANLDADADGYKEVIAAGYRFNSNNPNATNVGFTDSSDKISVYLAATYSYDAASKSYVSDGPATWITTNDDYYNDSSNMNEKVFSEDNIYNAVLAPLEVLGFSEKGSGCADSVFINGFVCDYYLNEGTVSKLPYDMESLSSSAFNARNGKFLFVSYAVPTNYVRRNNKHSRDGRNGLEGTVKRRWIGDAVAGNFDGDVNGIEELIFTYNCQYTDDVGKSCCAVVSVQKKEPGKLTDTKDLYDNELKINDDSSIYDEEDTMGSYYYSFAANDLWEEGENKNITLAAPDWDNDAIIAMPDPEKGPEYYFSDPYVVAVLQSSPYFEELSADYDFYPSSGSTSIELEKGSTSEITAGFTVSAGFILGAKDENSAGLIISKKISDIELKTTTSAHFSYEYSTEKEKSYSTAYSAEIGTDMVVLTMTPYVRYHYLTWDGENWGEITLDMPKTPRTTMVSVETYDHVAQASGWEQIRGNVLTSTPGDPYSYPKGSEGLSDFDGGKTIGGNSGNDWIGVGSGGTTSVGNITQTISSSTTDGYTVGGGISSEVENTATVGGATTGFTLSAEYTAGYSHASFSGVSFSGTVDNVPAEAASNGYDFLWRFGCWEDRLSYTNTDGRTTNKKIYVLGYLVKEITSLPKPPQDLTVVDFTEDSITLEWSHPERLPLYYIIYRKEAGGLVPLEAVRSNKLDKQQYVDTTCESGTSYTYTIVSVNYINGFETTGPNSPSVTGQTLSSDVPKISIAKAFSAIAGSSAQLKATVNPVPGGGTVSVQWQKWNGERYVNLHGATGTTYIIPKTELKQSGSRYRCYATQSVNGKWKVGYSTYGELTVLQRPTNTVLHDLSGEKGTCYYYDVNGLKVSGTVFSFEASVSETSGTGTPTGAVAFELINTSTGNRYTVTGTLNSKGTATATFEPSEAGDYTVCASYRGDGVYSFSQSGEKSFMAFSHDNNLLVITGEGELYYGDTLTLGAKLINSNGEENSNLNIENLKYEVTDDYVTSSDAEWITLKDNIFDPIESYKALNPLKNYVSAARGYTIRATYEVGKSTYTALKNITVKKASLVITVSNKEIKLTDLSSDYLNNIELTFNSFVEDAETQAQYRKLISIYTDAGFNKLPVGQHAIKLKFVAAPSNASDLVTYQLYLNQLIDNYNIITVNGELNVIDEWYTITYSGDENGIVDAKTQSSAIIQSGSQVLRGTTLTFSAAPATGYKINKWSVAGGKLNDDSLYEKNGSISSNINVNVSFSPEDYKLNWFVEDSVDGSKHGKLLAGNDSGIPENGSNVSSKEKYIFSAEPDKDYLVESWSVNGVIQQGQNGNTFELNGISSETTVSVKYVLARYYTVKAGGIIPNGKPLGGATVTPTPKDGKIIQDTTVTFAANVPANFYVYEWRLYSDETNYTVVQSYGTKYIVNSLDKDMNIKAVFVPAVEYKLSFETNDDKLGSIVAASEDKCLQSGKVYAAGIPLTFTVTPETGYYVESVTLQYDGTNEIMTIKPDETGNTFVFPALNGNITVKANFDKIVYTITAINAEHGKISPSGDTSVAYGESKSYKFTPSNGYSVEDVIVDGVSVKDQIVDNTYTFENVTSNHEISATFTTNNTICGFFAKIIAFFKGLFSRFISLLCNIF